DDLRHGWTAGTGRALRLAAAEARLLTRRPDDADAIVVGYPGHLDLAAARRAARGRPVVFNPLVSLADTLVGDRGRFRSAWLPARARARAVRCGFRSAAPFAAATQAPAVFPSGLGGRAALAVCFVGGGDRLFTPRWEPREPFKALFVGKLIPLQGVGTILA